MSKTRKGKAVAPSAPLFRDELATPVNGYRLLVEKLSEKPGRESQFSQIYQELWKEALGKFPLLARHYGIEWNQDYPDWASLALCLALDFVPGFSINTPPTEKKRKPGRPSERNWTSLYYRVDRLLSQNMSLTQACRYISKSDADFLGLEPSTLVSKFNEVKRALVKEASERFMRETAEDAKPTDIPKPN